MAEKYKKIHWTEHSKIKMRQYGLSRLKLIKLIYKPERKEVGIVPGTTAVMQSNKIYSKPKTLVVLKKGFFQKSIKKAPGEIWLMYKDIKDIRKVISAWRYPGVSKPGEDIPIPQDIRQELIDDIDLK